MGKKRRYIHKVKKFGRKMFDFLDKLDGTQDSKLLSSKIDTIVSKITVADRGNQTMSLQFEGMGPGVSPQAEGLEKDRVVYKVDGVTVNANGIQTFAAASGGAKGNKSRYKTTAAAPARSGAGASDVLLSDGQHTIEAHIIGEAAVAASATIEFTNTVTDSRTIIINDGAGQTTTYLAAGGNDAASRQFDRTHGNQATGLAAAIAHANGHDGSILTSVDGNIITLTNNVPGAAGNQDIGGTADNVTISNGSKMAGGFDADDAVKSQVLSKKFTIARSAVSVTDLDAALDEGASNGQLKITLSSLTVSGKRPGEEAAYDPLHDGAADGFKITAVDSTGAPITMSAAATNTDGDAAADEIDGLLDSALGATETITVTFTPLDSSDNPLSGDAVTTDIKITV